MKIKFVSICLILLLMLSGFLGFFNSNIFAQEFSNELPNGVETYLIHNYSDYKLYGLDHIKNLPKYNSQSLTEFHMPIVYKIPLNVKLDIKKFIKQGLFVNTNKNFNDRLLDSGYTVYGNLKSDEYFMVDYWIKVKASDKPFSIDFIPTIELNDRDYKLEKYAWWNSSYLLMKQLTIDHSYINNDLVDFPVLVYSNDTTILSKMDNGDSLRFTNEANDTEYYFEFEKFDDTTEMIVWVNISRIDSSVDTKFNMYYNNTDAVNGENMSKTWNDNYILVFHMNDASGSISDSSGNGFDFTNYGTPSYHATGSIGYGVQGDDASAYFSRNINMGSYLTNEQTISCWYNCLDGTGTASFIWSDLISAVDDVRFSFYYNGVGASGFSSVWDDGIAEGGADYTQSFRSFVFTLSTCSNTLNDITLYNNDSGGVCLDNDVDFNFAGLTNDPRVGARTCATDRKFFKGIIDEFRIMDCYVNSSWAKAEFHSQNVTTGFITFGSELVEDGCPDITYTNETPTNGATGINYLIDNLSVTINISFGNTFNYTIHCINGNTTTVNNSVNGTYQLNVSGLQPDTLYYWYVNTTHNATCGWKNVTYNFTTAISGCQCIDELTAILNKLNDIENILEGDKIIEMDATQFVIMVQLFLLCIFLWIGYTIPAMEGHKKSLHYMPFSGGLFIIFGGFDFISFAVLLTYNYELGIVGGFLTTVGIILLFYGILKAFYYELD